VLVVPVSPVVFALEEDWLVPVPPDCVVVEVPLPPPSVPVELAAELVVVWCAAGRGAAPGAVVSLASPSQLTDCKEKSGRADNNAPGCSRASSCSRRSPGVRCDRARAVRLRGDHRRRSRENHSFRAQLLGVWSDRFPPMTTSRSADRDDKD
jgi:hypothetical protein